MIYEMAVLDTEYPTMASWKKVDFQHLLSLNDNDVTEPSCEKIIPTLPV